MKEEENDPKSLFDHYFNSLEDSKQFEWVPPPHDFFLNKSLIIHEGILFEQHSISNLTSQNYYMLTLEYFIKCLVFLR